MSLNKTYRNKRCLITGATGFKGSWLTHWLKHLGANVLCMSDRIPTEPSFFKDLGHEYIECNVQDLNSFHQIIKQFNPEFIFHLAAQAITLNGYLDPLNTFQTNILGTANLLEYFRINDSKCTLIIVTSDKCYFDQKRDITYKEDDILGGEDPYGCSKAGAELVVKSYYQSYFKDRENIKLVTLRAGNVIGGGDWSPNRILPDTFRAWMSGKSLQLRNPDAIRPWQFVLEPLSAYLHLGALLEKNILVSGESFNIGPSDRLTYTVNDIISHASKLWSGYSSYEVNEQATFKETLTLKISSEKILRMTGWRSTYNTLEAVEKTTEWYLSYYSNSDDIAKVSLNQIDEFVNRAKEKSILWSS